jgi:hypothetical protein
MGDGGGGFEEIAVPGQVQYCRESLGAQTNTWAYFPSGSATINTFPPYGGSWGYYPGVGLTCRWQPH